MIAITAIIPLRAGSKRIPKKNIKLLNWKPLFTYTLDEALKSKYINEIIITTDDEDVINICQNDYKNYVNNWKIIILRRDTELSQDDTSTVDVILDVLDKYQSIENIILLQATSPFRKVKSIDKAIELFIDNDYNPVISISKVKEYPFWQHQIDKNWYLKPLLGLQYYNTRSQDLPKTYIENWAIYIASKKDFIKNKWFYSEKTKPIILDRIEWIDIDEPLDFDFCEFLIANKKLWNL